MTVHRYQLPRMIVRGVAQTLDADIYTDAGVQITPTAATLSLYAGGKTLLDGVSATAAAPSTYALLAATTAGEGYSTEYLEVWTLTVAGSPVTVQRPAYLVRRELHPAITDTDLLSYHTDLADLRDPDSTTFETQRDEAWVWINRRLIERGRRPQLIIDAWALRDVHVYKSLGIIFRDAALALGDGRYQELAEYYRTLADETLAGLSLQYDEDEDGFVDDGDQLPAHSVIFLS